jgi:hypothetical protein
MRRVPSNQRNSAIRRDRDVRALSRLALLLTCGLVLAGGFVFAARQHFIAVQYGYLNEGLRRERDKLLAEQENLKLKIEQEYAPSRLGMNARQLGLKPLEGRQVGAAKTNTRSRMTVAPALINPYPSLQR